MEPQEFKIGDVVILKSGGPKMTIEDVYDSNEWCKCIWFVDYKKYTDSFNMESLQRAE